MKIHDFMQTVYAGNGAQRRMIRYLYQHSGIGTRYSVLPDFSLPAGEWTFFPSTENLEPFPSLEKRMLAFQQYAAGLSMMAIKKCMKDTVEKPSHLITVSCTGMSAPGLDLEIMELLGLPSTTWRSSVNFMGCYAAIHALKIADAICRSEKDARVLIVCVECCTLHFQKDATEENIISSLLFGDGAAAMIVSADESQRGMHIDSFYSAVSNKGKKDMAWQLSSKGFLMTLSGYIPELIGQDFDQFVGSALSNAGLEKDNIAHWCIHPGGKKVLEAVHESLGFSNGQLQSCFDVLQDYGNMSSPTVLFVLEKIMQRSNPGNKVFGAAFGPGLTMESFILTS
jgi:predicted naringenin-chalcone synthase